MLSFHQDIRIDLAAIKANDSAQTYARILALMRQMHSDPSLADRLLEHGFGADKRREFSVSKWLAVWRQGKDLWRLKWWDLEAKGARYRFVYVYLHKEGRFVVMAIVKRMDFDYDNPQDAIRQRIFKSLSQSYGL
jgi:hypothetical protein